MRGNTRNVKSNPIRALARRTARHGVAPDKLIGLTNWIIRRSIASWGYTHAWRQARARVGAYVWVTWVELVSARADAGLSSIWCPLFVATLLHRRQCVETIPSPFRVVLYHWINLRSNVQLWNSRAKRACVSFCITTKVLIKIFTKFSFVFFFLFSFKLSFFPPMSSYARVF